MCRKSGFTEYYVLPACYYHLIYKLTICFKLVFLISCVSIGITYFQISFRHSKFGLLCMEVYLNFLIFIENIHLSVFHSRQNKIVSNFYTCICLSYFTTNSEGQQVCIDSQDQLKTKKKKSRFTKVQYNSKTYQYINHMYRWLLAVIQYQIVVCFFFVLIIKRRRSTNTSFGQL